MVVKKTDVLDAIMKLTVQQKRQTLKTLLQKC